MINNFYVNNNREILVRLDYYELASGYHITNIWGNIFQLEKQEKLNYILKNKKLKLRKSVIEQGQ